MYCFHGGRLPSNECGITFTFKQSLKWFTKQSRRLLRQFGNHETVSLIRPYVGNRLRLAQYGFAQHVSCVSAQLSLVPEMAAATHNMLASLKGVKSKAKITHAIMSKYSFPKRPPWIDMCTSQAIPDTVSRLISQHEEDICLRGNTHNLAGTRPSIFVLICPKCHRARNVARRRLFNKNKRIQIKCKHCKCVSTSSKWNCECGVTWGRCATHRSIGFRCGSVRKAPHRRP